jgi:hypothetical protein
MNVMINVLRDVTPLSPVEGTYFRTTYHHIPVLNKIQNSDINQYQNCALLGCNVMYSGR